MTDHVLARCTACGMPVPTETAGPWHPLEISFGHSHNCPSMMAMPSRDFLIRQAVLNMAATRFPTLFRTWGSATILSHISLGGTILSGTSDIVDAIRAEFRVLVAKHGGTTCPSR